MAVTLRDIISNISRQNEEALIFARKVDGKFLSTSEALIVEPANDEMGSPANEIADKHCPGFEYFLEVFLVKEIMEDLRSTVGYKSLEQQADRVIQYAEFDA